MEPNMDPKIHNKQNVINLKSLKIGNRKLRYIHLKNKSFQQKTTGYANSSTLLFFGSDVLSNTSISTKNMAREHFHQSKSHRCCKASFPSRLGGVGGSAKEAWFYDVKGLMCIAFSFYTFQDQLLIMRCLFTLWSSTTCFTLPPFLTITQDDIIMEEFLPTVLIDTHHKNSCHICEAENTNEETVRKQNHRDLGIQASIIMVTRATQFESKCNYSCSVACQTETLGESAKSTESISTKGTLISPTEKLINENKTIGKSLKRRFTSSPNESHTNQFLEKISKLLKKYDSTSSIFFYKVYILFETFLFLVRDELHIIEATTTGIFPFHLMIEYVNFKKQYQQKVNSDIPAELYFQDGLLQIYGRWLGTQFNNFQNVIASQMEEYKKVLISQNKFLPTSIKLITESGLYPSSMIEFLNLWLHGGHQKEDHHFECSKILLVLELMNDNLITGVGHVVYAKLKSTDSM